MAFYGGPRGPPPPPWQVVVAPGQPRPYYYNPVTTVSYTHLTLPTKA